MQRSTIIKIVIAIVATVALVFGIQHAASAAPAEQTITKLSHIAYGEANFYSNTTGAAPSTDGFTKWRKNVADSPLDRGTSMLVMNVPAGTPDGNYYNLFYSDRSTDQNKLVTNIKNLSYDIRSSNTGAGGAPRISVELNNGDVAYLASETCHRALTIDSSWSRADFTGAKHNCGFYVTGDAAGFYEADGSQSAWSVFAAAHPELRVSQTYVVADAPGKYRLDRISLGTAYMYTSYYNKGVLCLADETRC